MVAKKINLPFKLKKSVLALGSQTKNTVCFAQGNSAYISPLHSDLNNPKDLLNFQKDVKYCLKKKPKIIAYDLHPEYQSTKFAQDLSPISYRLSPIQHHHAHIASCMLENGLKHQMVIGVAFDGTGLGVDNRIWGAEFLLCNYKNFARPAYLKEVPLLGGERAIQEPFRVAAFWLYSIYKERFLNLGIDFLRGIDRKRWRALERMYLAGVNSPLASSAGRLFDAVASLVLAKQRVRFEAEFAIELERLAISYQSTVSSYKFKVTKKQNSYILDPIPMFREIVRDLKSKEPKEKIAYRFHLTVAEMIKETCLLLRKKTQINKVVLSGGVFQNSLLLSLAFKLLYKAGFLVFIQRDLSCNDSGISLGQAVIANFKG